MSEKNIERRPLKTRGKKWVAVLATLLLKTGIKPDQISMIGVLFAAGAGIFLYLGKTSAVAAYYLFTAVFIQLRLLCNMMDGVIAIEGKLKSKLGDIFNELPDRCEDLFILVCAGYAAANIALGWAAAALAILTAYIRAFGASIGTKQYYCGPMAKPQRMFILTVACLLEFFIRNQGGIIAIGLWIIVIGSILTSIRRGMLIIDELKSK